MPLETERNLRLALPAKANDLVQILIRLRLGSIGNRRRDHPMPLLQNGVRLDLIHKNTFAFKSVTHGTSHSFSLSLILWRSGTDA
jgi:hypothetical protein